MCVEYLYSHRLERLQIGYVVALQGCYSDQISIQLTMSIERLCNVLD